jgi:predicted membrane chloride channel (bestrophin family)
MLNLVAAFPYLLRHHIRPGCLCEKESPVDLGNGLLLREPSINMVETRHEGDKQTIRGTTQSPSFMAAPMRECWVDRRKLPWNLMEHDSLKHIASAHNRPLWICDRIAREVMSIPYGPNFTSRERLSLLGSIEKLTNTVGECERIHQTAVPLNYARHSLRSLTLWHLTVPFALVKDMGLMTGPAVGIMAWLLFGVYQIGYSIEDPFQGSLRLSNLCDAIRRDVLGGDGVRETAHDIEEDEPPVLDYSHHQLFPNPIVEAASSLISQTNATWAPVGV